MEGNQVELEWVLGGIATVIAALSGSVTYLFKLYYVDTKKAQADCEKNNELLKAEFKATLKEEKEDCKKDIDKLSALVDSKQAQLSDLHRQVFDLAKNQSPPGSQILKG